MIIKPILLHSSHSCLKLATPNTSHLQSCLSACVRFAPTCSVSTYDPASAPTTQLHPVSISLADQPKYGAVDSAASKNYFPWSYVGDAHDPNHQSVSVGTANNGLMRSVAADIIKLAQLPLEARRCLKFKEITLPLLSVGQFCQHGMEVTFTKDDVTVRNQQGLIVLTGHRDPIRNLYLVRLDNAAVTTETIPKPRVTPKLPSLSPKLPSVTDSAPRVKLPITNQPIFHPKTGTPKNQPKPPISKSTPKPINPNPKNPKPKTSHPQAICAPLRSPRIEPPIEPPPPTVGQ